MQAELKEKLHEYCSINTQKWNIILHTQIKTQKYQQVYVLRLPQNKFVVVLKQTKTNKIDKQYFQKWNLQQNLNYLFWSQQANVKLENDMKSSGFFKIHKGMFNSHGLNNQDVLWIYYLDNEGNILNKVMHKMSLNFSLYPYSSHQIIIVATNIIRVTKIQKIDLKIKQQKIITFLTEIPQTEANYHKYLLSQKIYQQDRYNVIFFSQSKSFCLLNPPHEKIFDYIKVQFRSFSSKNKKIGDKIEMIIQVNKFSQFQFSKGNNFNMLIWYPKIVTTKVIYFCFFEFNTQMTQPVRILIKKPLQFQNKQIQILKVFQVCKGKYFLAFKIQAIVIFTIYHIQTKVLSFITDDLYYGEYQLIRAEISIPQLIRIVLRKNKGNQKTIGYIDASSNKIIALNYEISNTQIQYQLISYNNIRIQKGQKSILFNITSKKIEYNPTIALTFLLQQLCQYQLDDDLVFYALNLVGLV